MEKVALPTLGEAMSSGFAEFYSAYPRKMARKDAERAWAKLTPDEQSRAFEALPVHCAYWAARGEKEFIPYPATWLNGARFDDELEMPKPKADPSWCKSERGILDEGARRGLKPRAGESLWDYRARIEAA